MLLFTASSITACICSLESSSFKLSCFISINVIYRSNALRVLALSGSLGFIVAGENICRLKLWEFGTKYYPVCLNGNELFLNKCLSYLLTLRKDNKNVNVVSHSFRRPGHNSKILVSSPMPSPLIPKCVLLMTVTFLAVRIYLCTEVHSPECELKLFEIQRSSSSCCLP